MSNISGFCIFTAISIFVGGPSVLGETIYVDTNATGPAHDGSSWCDAYLYLQDALAAAAGSGGTVDDVRVADGSYKPDQGSGQSPADREATFQLISGVTIAGGYAGCGAPDPNERDIVGYETILSGDLTGDDVVVAVEELVFEPTRAENSLHVVTGSGTDVSALLDGCIVTGGQASISGLLHSFGGGMLILQGAPTVTNCTFRGNGAIIGAGMANKNGGAPTVSNCTFIGNSARFTGGGMANDRGSAPTVTDCTFTGNSARVGGGMDNLESAATVINCNFIGNSASGGGGMFNFGSGTTVINCTFAGNTGERGGGMYNERGIGPTVINCTFRGNVALNSGGGMFNWIASPNLTDCTFGGNSADGGGGMYNGLGSRPLLTNCTFDDNSAENGGAIFNGADSSPTLSDCKFHRNTAFIGGGIHNSTSGSRFTNCIFTENSASGSGGAMYNSNSFLVLRNSTFHRNSANLGGGIYFIFGNGLATVINCIFRSNGPSEIYDNNSGPSVSYSNIQGGWPGTGNIDADPLFVPGPGGCFYLSQVSAGQAEDSLCVDGGSDTAANLGFDTLTTRSDEAVDMGLVDMGYHYPVTDLPLVMGDYDRNQIVNLADFAGLQGCLSDSGSESVLPCCRIFDFEPDDDVDLDDFVAFLAALSSR